jgi:hypothetical protein
VVTGTETAWRKIYIKRYFEKNFSGDIFDRFGSSILNGTVNYQDEELFKVNIKVKNSECI